jgi:hypothetical protein
MLDTISNSRRDDFTVSTELRGIDKPFEAEGRLNVI